MGDRLRDEVDLEAWDTAAPRADFAERVVARATGAKRSRRRLAAWGGLALAAAAAALFLGTRPPPNASGEITADRRVEVAIGARAVAVLAPGAHIAWHGGEVTQDHGDVFYRVEHGAPFRVSTPAGDAIVHGTCFGVAVEPPSEKDMHLRDLKSAGIGAALSAVAFVGVYEGKVALAKGQSSVELTAGQTGRADGSGVERGGDFDPAAASSSNPGDDAPYVQANRNLVDQIADYQRRLDALENQKKALGAQLADAQDKLAASTDGAAPTPRSQFDLSQDDWKRLAETGSVKYEVPCTSNPNGYTPGPKTLDKLGLAPQDASVIHDAYGRSTKRVWDLVGPLCAQALGGSTAVADKLGADACVHVVLDLERQHDPNAVNEAMRQVAEIRAGERPAPGPNDKVDPVETIFLALTGESQQFESDLAQSLGPDDAHRVVYTPHGLNMCGSTFGGPGPRQR
jgi:hypothetical protein